MEQALYDFIQTATTFQKGVFLMIVGVLFVFAVQTVFYVTVKIWARKKK
jgi:Na+-transporting methylmalonyl-CoA/oxaloacetate decarboxylase gamma subunit